MNEKTVLLIDPLCKNSKYESPNVKLGSLSAVLMKNGYDSDIYDFVIEDIDNIFDICNYIDKKGIFLKKLKKKITDYDYIYLNCEYGLLKTCIEIANIVKGRSKVIIGGTYINYLYAGGVLVKLKDKLNCFDYISTGDIEKDVVNIIKNDDFSMHKAEVCNYGMVEDLDSIPFPLWSKYNYKKYDGKLYIVASKGCSYNRCKFCDERLIWGNKFRNRDYKCVVKEIIYDIKEYGINNFFFWDASISSYKYVRELCNEIIKNKVNCNWVALTRVDELTEELVQLYKKAGCSSIEIGIESLNDETLREMNKGITYEMIIKAVELLHKYDIKVEGSFLIGYPGENKEQMLKTIEKSKKLNLDFYRWHNYQLSANYIKEHSDLIDIDDWIEADLNYPNQFLSQVIPNNKVSCLDMHIVTKMGENYTESVPQITIGKLTLKEIHELTRYAINETRHIAHIEGHNPYI